MVYTRGSKGEWDRYADIGGNEGLRWDNILQILKKVRLIGKSEFPVSFSVMDSKRNSRTVAKIVAI